jgi:signal transduction histidine kinase
MAEAMLATETGDQGVDLREKVEAQVEEVRSTSPDAIVRIADSVPSIEVAADEMLRSVFRNLLKNAVIHNDAAVPVVSVSATQADETVQVCITDNGPGIPDEQKDRVFGKGERGLESPGTGIGLYLVSTLVDRYEGSVWVEDREPTGSVFVVELSLADPVVGQ